MFLETVATFASPLVNEVAIIGFWQQCISQHDSMSGTHQIMYIHIIIHMYMHPVTMCIVIVYTYTYAIVSLLLLVLFLSTYIHMYMKNCEVCGTFCDTYYCNNVHTNKIIILSTF